MVIETKSASQAPAPANEMAGDAASDIARPLSAWDAFVMEHPYGELLQLSAWRALKCRFGWTSSRATVEKAGCYVGGAEILYRRAYGLTLAYAPRGPVVDWEDAARVEQVLLAVETEAKAAGASVLKLEPPVPDSLAMRQQLHAWGYSPSLQTVQPPSTIRVCLEGDEAAILQRMKSKWRYNVRLAGRKGVSVRAMHSEDLPAFNRLMAVTAERDSFAVHSPDYYAAAFDLLTPEHGVFLLAEYNGKPLAAIVVAHCGATASYLWGASNNAERQRMPNHALQWAGMQWAKARGARWYDLWGVPDAIGQLALGMNRGAHSRYPADELPVNLEQLPDDELWGVYRFKQGFGGETLRYVGAWDKPLSSVGGRVYAIGLHVREIAQSVRRAENAREAAERLAQAVARPLRSEPLRLQTNLRLVSRACEWRVTLARFPAPHVLQSWEWGEIKAQTGWDAQRLVWTDADGQTPRAAFQLLRRRFVPGLPWAIGYAPKGPATDWDALDAPDTLLDTIERAARDLGCIFVKIDPDVREDTESGSRLLAAMRQRGWRYSPTQIQFKNTAFTDLQAGEDALLAVMKSKWRYNIRLAQRRGITVRQGATVDLPHFYGLYAQTGARDGFLVRPYGYYLETWRSFLQAQQEPANPAGGALLLAEHPDEIEPVAGLFLMRYGARAWYFYGASSDRRRRDMPNYLLQWEALRWSLAHGCTVYDWWGAPTDPDDPEDGLQGVWQFKQGFGAELQQHVGAWDFPVYPRLYAAFTEALPRVVQMLRRFG